MTILNFSTPINDFIFLFQEKISLLNVADTMPNIEVVVYRLKDGYVYLFDGLYCLSDIDNNVAEMILSDPRLIGLQIINTRKVSKESKQLTSIMERFLKLLNVYITNLMFAEKIEIKQIDGKYLEDYKEHIIKEYSVY